MSEPRTLYVIDMPLSSEVPRVAYDANGQKVGVLVPASVDDLNIKQKHYAVVNDLIGGYDVSIHNKTTGDHGPDEFTMAWGMTKEVAERVAKGLDLLAALGGTGERGEL